MLHVIRAFPEFRTGSESRDASVARTSLPDVQLTSEVLREALLPWSVDDVSQPIVPELCMRPGLIERIPGSKGATVSHDILVICSSSNVQKNYPYLHDAT